MLIIWLKTVVSLLHGTSNISWGKVGQYFSSCCPVGGHIGSLWGPQEGPRQWSVGFNAPEVCISAGKCIGKCAEVPKINWFAMRFFRLCGK